MSRNRLPPGHKSAQRAEKPSYWFIDALDARAGLVFAALQPFSPPDERIVAEAANILFFSPPEFEPQSVGNRAIGFSAAQASFQEGLFVEGREVAFPNWEAVAEFLRRVYLRSGGGDAPPTGDGPPLPPEEPKPPIGPDEEFDTEEPKPPIGPHEEFDTEDSPTGRLLFCAHAFERKVPKAMPQSDGQPIEVVETENVWNDLGQRGSMGSGRIDRFTEAQMSTLCRAAYQILLELIRTEPAPTPSDAAFAWTRSVGRFFHALQAIRLRPAFMFWLQEGRRLAHLAVRVRHDSDLLQHMQMDSDYFAELHNYGHGRLLDMPSWRWPHWEYRTIKLPTDSGDFDPLSDLEGLPVPLELAHGVVTEGEADPVRPSLRNLLFALLGSPQDLLASALIGRQRAEMLLFAAAVIAASGTGRPEFSSRDKNLIVADAARCCAKGEAWLAFNLPKKAFPYRVELEIQRASRLAYISKPAELHDFVRSE
jgi:hypothetical protein